MNRLLLAEWDQLIFSTPARDAITARAVSDDSSGRIYCGIDVQGGRHLLVRLKEAEAGLDDTQSRGLKCSTRELATASNTADRYIDLECRDPRSFTVLDLLAFDLIELINEGDGEAAEVVSVVLNRWRRFWSRGSADILTRDAQLGLFSELWFLAFWMFPNVGTSDALNRWVGPLGARHDFAWNAKAIEVKSTVSTRGRVFTISSLDQLEPPENGTLALFGLTLREDSSATNSLPALISTIDDALRHCPETRDQFESRLDAAGYSRAHTETYSQMTLRVCEECLFSVHSDFPRLTCSDLPRSRFPGIESVQYEINLSTFEHLKLSDALEISRLLA